MDKIKEFFKPENLKPFVKRCWPYGAGALVVLVAALILALTTCSGPADNTQPTTTVPPTTTAAPETTVAPTTTVPPTTAAPLLFSEPLTGVAIAEPNTNRPIAVMLNNIKAAMPQHGISQADFLYEILAEGGVTRCMGVFHNIGDVEKIGSIRSARKYYIDVALGYGAGYVHAGGSNEALAYLQTLANTDLDGAKSSKYFKYDEDRLNAGYSSEHSYFTSGSNVLGYAGDINVTTKLDAEPSYGLVFDDEYTMTGEDAKVVTVYFNQGGEPTAWTKSTELTYDEQTKCYFAEQHGGENVDGNTGEQVSFRNILVLKAPTSLQADGYLLTVNTTGSGEGWFVRDGKVETITWSRETVNDPFVYTLASGEVITMGVGSTYCAIVPTNSTTVFE